jgi:fructose-bisphosphate aldolase class II
MPAARMAEIVGPAAAAGRGVGAFNVIGIPRARTDPGDAARYVGATGVDALAVGVGSSHAMLTRDAVLDTGLIARIHAAVSVPLVLRGSSGVPDAALAAAVAAGMTKINVATQLNKAFTAAVEVARLLRVIGAGIAGRDESPGTP